MKLCDTCKYRNNVEQLKPCIIYRDDCEYYEKEREDMTREEALNKWVLPALKRTWNDKKVKEILKALEQEPKTDWILVSERLPEESHAVFIWCPERKNIYCACYENNQWWIFGSYFEKVKLKVIAWMPLPKPYEPQESEGEE